MTAKGCFFLDWLFESEIDWKSVYCHGEEPTHVAVFPFQPQPGHGLWRCHRHRAGGLRENDPPQLMLPDQCAEGLCLLCSNFIHGREIPLGSDPKGSDPSLRKGAGSVPGALYIT